MNNLNFFLLCLILSSACTNPKPKNQQKQTTVDDSSWVVDASFETGHVGRYGIRTDVNYNQTQVKKLLEINSLGVPLFFPEGTYRMNLIIDGSKNHHMVFNNATIAGQLHIIGQEAEKSSNINLKGQLTVLDKVFMRHAENISIETLHVVSDETNSLREIDNPGVSIYAGVDKVSIDSLFIENTIQSDLDHNKFSAAAFQVHGWNNNPKNINIDYLEIKNSGRSGVYLTGQNHEIGRLIIDTFGVTESTNMAGLEDTTPGTEKNYKALWINKCNNCIVYEAEILQEPSENTYHLAVGVGDTSKPSIIEQLSFISENGEVSVKERIPSNVIVKNTTMLDVR